MNKISPICKKSRTSVAKSSHTKLLSNKESSERALSKGDTADPKRMHWKMEKAKSIRAKDWKNGTEPSATGSKIGRKGSVRVLMMTEESRSSLAKLCIKRLKPSFKKSKTNTAKPD